MVAISQGLRDGAFFRSLMKNPLGGYDELLGRAEKQINVEEAQKARQSIKGPASKSNLTGKGKEPQPAPSKLEKYKSFPTGAQRRPMGVISTEYPHRPRTIQVRDMAVCE